MVCTSVVILWGVNALLGLFFFLKVLTGDRSLSSLGFGCMRLWFQLEVLIPVNSSMLCHSVLIGRVKHMGRAQTLPDFSEVCLKHVVFAFAWLEVTFWLYLQGWGCPHGNCQNICTGELLLCSFLLTLCSPCSFCVFSVGSSLSTKPCQLTTKMALVNPTTLT